MFQGKDLNDIPQEHLVASSSSNKEPLRKLAVPPLYAAEVPARASQLTPTVKQEFNKALDCVSRSKGLWAKGQSANLDVVGERPPERKEEDGAAQNAQMQLQMGALASQVQALTTAQQTQHQVNAQLQLEKELGVGSGSGHKV